jgi:UPF0271 protein
MASPSVDLSADVGEAVDHDGIAVERALLGVVSSIHVACGGHAGDAVSMRDTVVAALERGVEVGAHPSYPDRDGFGRRPMPIDAADLEASLRHQIGALVEVCAAAGTTVRSVKAHGALYAQVALGGSAFDALRAALAASADPVTALVLPAGSPAEARGRAEGVVVWREGFCDRAYAPDGTLVDRSVSGAVFDDPNQAAAQALHLLGTGGIDSLCVHGDTPGVVALAAAVRLALRDAGVAVAAPALR